VTTRLKDRQLLQHTSDGVDHVEANELSQKADGLFWGTLLGRVGPTDGHDDQRLADDHPGWARVTLNVTRVGLPVVPRRYRGPPQPFADTHFITGTPFGIVGKRCLPVPLPSSLHAGARVQTGEEEEEPSKHHTFGERDRKDSEESQSKGYGASKRYS